MYPSLLTLNIPGSIYRLCKVKHGHQHFSGNCSHKLRHYSAKPRMLVNQQWGHYQSGKPLSTDLQKLILEEIVHRGGDLASGFFPRTFVDIANHFHVSPAFVSKF